MPGPSPPDYPRPAHLERLVLDPEYQFGEAYSQGRLEVEGDLRRLLEIFYRTRRFADAGSHPLRKILVRLLHSRRSNSIAAARENIHRHYDVGNDFYQLWLDPQMIYSCAYFARNDMTLAEAQVAKLNYVCRKLCLRRGETVLEVGGGWGGLAIHMARHFGVFVKAFNISRRQIDFARRRAQAEGLDGRVEFIEDDYRNISGRFDALVSLGMLEHVGRKHYRDFGRMADRCLAPHGRGLIQTIAQDRPIPTNPWIQRRIFPGGHAPTLREMTDIVEPFGFSVLDLENLRPHYAKTLGHWLGRFEGLGRERGRNVRRQVRPHVAAISFRVLGGIRQRGPAIVPIRFRPPGNGCISPNPRIYTPLRFLCWGRQLNRRPNIVSI